MVFLKLRWEHAVSSRVMMGMALQNWCLFSVFQDSCLVARDALVFSSRLGRAIGTPLVMKQETQGHFPVATGILQFLAIFKRSQASSPVEACNSSFLFRCQRGMQPTVMMRQGTRALSLGSTGDSDIPSYWQRIQGLHLSHCREIMPHLEGGELGVHST